MSNRLPILAAEINAAHEKFSTAAKTALDHAIVVGERLIEAKPLVGHGKWLPWLKANCAMSERQAQKYMRVAKAKSALGADLTINAAIEALSTAKPVSLLPPAGFIKIGERESLTVVVAPSYQHPGFFYVVRFIQNNDKTGELIGGRRPIRHDHVEAMLMAMVDNIDDFVWQDVPSAAWVYNELLFDTPAAYLNSFCLADTEDRVELVSLAEGAEPIDFGVHIRRQVMETPQ
ncbi:MULTISPECIES: DUF3102 domain-containing protein [Bradyrhizobium]|uniref:DUF3102 domain-containing protein n=1 Tax=Bradyrhizobium elkanii TaxID=29448 RepID=UPI00271553B0|nr:DUF3102 domain-containing protein [Bradyrhizobium elkanii]WLB84906.1 DUF3102 domain-containing protein [Bradyrhizobium elkanii]